MADLKIGVWSRILGAVLGWFLGVALVFLFTAIFVRSDNYGVLFTFCLIARILQFYFVYRGLRYGIKGMFRGYPVLDLRDDYLGEIDKNSVYEEQNTGALPSWVKRETDSPEKKTTKELCISIKQLRDRFDTCSPLLDEIDKYISKNPIKVATHISENHVTPLQWLFKSIKTLSSNKIERGGFVYAGAPDIQGMEYLNLFDYATDKLAELEYEDYSRTLAREEKAAFRKYLIENFG